MQYLARVSIISFKFVSNVCFFIEKINIKIVLFQCKVLVKEKVKWACIWMRRGGEPVKKERCFTIDYRKLLFNLVLIIILNKKKFECYKHSIKEIRLYFVAIYLLFFWIIISLKKSIIFCIFLWLLYYYLHFALYIVIIVQFYF